MRIDRKLAARAVDVLESNASRMEMGPPETDAEYTKILRSQKKLRAKNKGDFHSATISAAFYAKKWNEPVYVYGGNMYGHAVFRVSAKPGDYLSPINNTGGRMASVTPDLEFRWHSLKRPW